MSVYLVLASASRRRRELLEGLGIRPRVLASNVDETAQPGERAEAFARRVAGEKARAVAARADVAPGTLVLGADTTVVVPDADGGERLLGKPRDAKDARAMLQALSGRRHAVVTGWALARAGAPADALGGVVSTEVDVRALRDDEIDGYLATDEWRDKAGAYAVQGIFSAFVRALHGSYANVVGLPVCEVVEGLRAAGWFEGRRFP